MPISLRTLCLVTLVLCNIHGSLEHEIPRRSSLSRRAIDGTRGRKYFDPDEEGVLDSYGSAGGQYDSSEDPMDFADIRMNVPGEPGIDYPAYTTLPQTGFTCEGRSRGYYADEMTDCQVFHVCHDELVSSFLCPIGSLFSQKLLTCDWWTKVDCSSSGEYIGANRDSYQLDDDEMIRNAYAMVSLQSGTDVTKDGLVDPDRTGAIVDYDWFAGRLFDYYPSGGTGNDLRNTYDYSGTVDYNSLPAYRTSSKNQETSRNYQERFSGREKVRKPVKDSPIIRVQNTKAHEEQRTRGYQDSHRKSEFANQFQPSYAPTVPTVTTTTRRFYSPTVPTTVKHSTVAYNKLDQAIDSSEYYFSHSGTKSLVTPSIRSFAQDSGRSPQLARAKVYEDSVRSIPQSDDNHGEKYEDDYGEEIVEDEGGGSSAGRFQVKVTDDYRGNDEEGVDDIETRGSIGLGHALRQPIRGVTVKQHNLVTDQVKSGKAAKEQLKEGYQDTLARPKSTVADDDEQTTEPYQRDDRRDDLEPSTIPPFVESTIKATTVNDTSRDKEKGVTDRIDRSGEFLSSKEPRNPTEPTSKFQIKVTDQAEVSSTLLIRDATIDDPSHPGARDYVRSLSLPSEKLDYEDVESFTDSRIQGHSSTPARPLISSSGRWFSSSDRLPTRSPQFGSSSAFGGDARVNDTQDKGVGDVEKLEDNRSSPATQRSLEDVEKRLGEIENEQKAIESSTVNLLFRSITPATLKQIEENIDKTSSPYQVTLTVNKDKDLVSNDDLIGKLVAQQGKEVTTLIDKADELEVMKFTETEPPTTIQPEDIAAKNLDQSVDYYQIADGNLTGEYMDSLKNLSTVNLFQLMYELLKVNRYPRPFSLGNMMFSDQSSGAEGIAKDVNSGVQNEDYGKLEETSATENPVPFKEKTFETLGTENPVLSKEIFESLRTENPVPSKEIFEIHRTENRDPSKGKIFETLRTENPVPSKEIFETLRTENRDPLNEKIFETPIKEYANPSKEKIFETFGTENPVPSKEIFETLRTENRDPSKEKFFEAPIKEYAVLPKEKIFESPITERAIPSEEKIFETPASETTVSLERKIFETPTTESSVPLKERILGKLSQSFGSPRYRNEWYVDVPLPERALDFQTGLPLKRSEVDGETNNERSNTTDKSPPKASVTTTTPKPTLTTEFPKEIVHTLFVPSIGFSFDTNKGRSEYVDAVLGGLIDPQFVESRRKETLVGLDGETLFSENGTSDGDAEKIKRGTVSSEKEVTRLE
ncbi:uncharacterized protein LOC117218800 [Megalopta genalis]|uniref:uncharacterized protein LOC117218800 n=1 Tax=Megalopta genalis TaxID=115081 RepID=UPI003FD1C8A3